MDKENTKLTPSSNVIYSWKLSNGAHTIEVLTKESKASSEITRMVAEGYRILRRRPISVESED